MRAFAAVFSREIHERRILFVVALASGLVPLLVSLATGWSRPDAAELRVLVALVGAAALSAAFALLLGAAVIAGETREKRISFFFARPIPSGAIWAGKLLAAIAITIATALLAFAPGWLSGNARARNLWGLDATPGRAALAALVLAVVFVLGSHAIVTIARLRSPWVALDLILAPALVFLAAVSLRSLLKHAFANDFGAGGHNALSRAFAMLVAAVFAALIVATFAQVAEGRTDARRAHGAFSVAFFGISGAAVALVGAYAWWCASARATDLAQLFNAQAAPRGSWVVVGGRLGAWRGGGSFLFDTASGRSLRVQGWNVAFSQDGTRAVWGEPRFGFFERKDNRADLVVADLASGRTFQTGLESANIWSDLALSPNGTRLALRDGTTLQAFDISNPANPQQIAAFSLEGEGRAFTFVDGDTLRMFPRTYNARSQKLAGPSLEIADFNLSSKKVVVTGRLDAETLPFLNLSADARFLVGSRSLSDDPKGKRALTLHDGRTGVLLSTVADNLRNPHLRFLAGGGFVVAGIDEGLARLLCFKGENAAPFPVNLGPAARAVLGREISPGRVIVALNSSDKNDDAMQRSWKIVAVDVASGAVFPVGIGLAPLNLWWSATALLSAPEAGSPFSRLFLDADGRLIRLDPATGARTVLLGKGK